jgi:hypothetical protein
MPVGLLRFEQQGMDIMKCQQPIIVGEMLPAIEDVYKRAMTLVPEDVNG